MQRMIVDQILHRIVMKLTIRISLMTMFVVCAKILNKIKKTFKNACAAMWMVVISAVVILRVMFVHLYVTAD